MRDNHSKRHDGESQPPQHFVKAPRKRAEALVASEKETQNKYKLPSQGVEEPDAFNRPGREIHAERERIDIDRER